MRRRPRPTRGLSRQEKEKNERRIRKGEVWMWVRFLRLVLRVRYNMEASASAASAVVVMRTTTEPPPPNK